MSSALELEIPDPDNEEDVPLWILSERQPMIGARRITEADASNPEGEYAPVLRALYRLLLTNMDLRLVRAGVRCAIEAQQR